MENKKIVSAGSISWSLIGWSLLYGFCLNILYTVIFNLLTGNMENLIITFVISLILQAACAHLMWYCSISSAFKKKTIVTSDLSTVVRNIFIYTIVLLAIYSIGSIYRVDQTIDDYADQQFKLYDTYSQYLLSDESLIEYQQLREQAIEDAKAETYNYLVVLLICIAVVYIAMIFVARALMKKRVVDDANINPISSPNNYNDINNGPIS